MSDNKATVRSIAVRDLLWEAIKQAAARKGIGASEFIRTACLEKMERDRNFRLGEVIAK